MPESCCVLSAVRVSVRAADSSSTDAPDTAPTMLPTVVWNSSASRPMSRLRCSAVRPSFSFCSARSRSASTMLLLNVCVAAPSAPISSLRSPSEISADMSPCASRRMTSWILSSGPVTRRDTITIIVPASRIANTSNATWISSACIALACYCAA